MFQYNRSSVVQVFLMYILMNKKSPFNICTFLSPRTELINDVLLQTNIPIVYFKQYVPKTVNLHHKKEFNIAMQITRCKT